MARKKDLGGLAALAGLAYMASRDKASKGAAPMGPMGDDQYNPDVKQRSAAALDMGEIRDEEGTLSKLRRNTETGEMYDPGSVGPTAPARKPAPPVARRVPAGGKGIENARDAILMRQGRSGLRSTDDTINPDVKQRLKDDQYNPQVKQYRDDTYDPKIRRGMNKENLEATGETFKKGGAVKGWGISRGARKAKVY
jgi:hypothetical protein